MDDLFVAEQNVGCFAVVEEGVVDFEGADPRGGGVAVGREFRVGDCIGRIENVVEREGKGNADPMEQESGEAESSAYWQKVQHHGSHPNIECVISRSIGHSATRSSGAHGRYRGCREIMQQWRINWRKSANIEYILHPNRGCEPQRIACAYA